MQRNAKPLQWYPKGASDTLDATKVFEGAMASLQNLIPDPTTPFLFQCRPAAFSLINFAATGGPFSSGFSSGFLRAPIPGAGFISCTKVVGGFIYGMIANSLFPGFDIPFCFNLITNTIVPVSGIAAGTLPASPLTTGAWVPPIMDVVGSKVMLTHQGFGATANFIGWIDISNPTGPVWHAGNLTGAISFSTVPTFVAQFNGRAYYLVNTVSQPAAVFSDPLNPTNVTNATQVLTFGDTEQLTAIGQLKLYAQAGGIIQSLMVFKGVENTYQVTGDSALGTLTVNALNVATGTICPLGIAATKGGLAFVSPDGVRIIDFMGNVSNAIGDNGRGISVPFIYTNVPSRVCMAASGDVLRITTQNAAAPGTPQQEWWYDMSREVWTGPHTSANSLITSFQDTFITCPLGVFASLWQSDVVQSATSSFVENGAQLLWNYQTAFLPDLGHMSNIAVSQSLLEIALASSAAPVSVSCLDPSGLVFDTVSLALAGAPTIWGAFTWGSAVWGSPQGALLPRQLPWHQPLVFARAAFVVSGQSNSSLKIGALHLKYKMLRYLTDIGAVA